MARDASTQPDISRLEKVAPMQSAIGSPPFRQWPPSANPFLRSPLAPMQWIQPDSLRQFYDSTLPQSRIAPMQANATATINSTANSVARTVVEQNTITNSLALQVNGSPNADQLLLNLQNGAGIKITDLGAGNVSISGSASGLPLPNSGLYFMARAVVGQTGLQTWGDASTSAVNGGVVSISNGAFPTASIGVSVPFAVASGAGAAYNGWMPINSSNNANGIFRAGRNCKYQARAAVNSIAGVVTFFGFSTADPSNHRTFPFTSATQYLGIYSPGIGIADTWHATIHGSSVDTGVPIGGLFFCEIIMNDSTNSTSFSVNGSAPTVITGSNPSGINWFPTATFAVNVSVLINFNIEYFYGSQDF